MPDLFPVLSRSAETLALHDLRPHRSATKRVAAATSAVSERGRLWIGLTAVAATSPRTRRAGLDGLTAWALASAGAFGIKRFTHRRRPRLVPSIGPSTSSSSMPSSHTAGAFAYAVAAALSQPMTGFVLVPIAGAVAWSRAATARHFPTDIAAGALLGVAVGAAVQVVSDRGQRGATGGDRAHSGESRR